MTALAVTASAFAQSFLQQEVTNAVAKEVVMPAAPSVAAVDPTDTLGFDDFGNEIWLYSSNSGYVFGTNDLEGQVQGQTVHQLNYEYARGFISNGANTVLGAVILFAVKEDVSGSPAAANVKVWSLADNKAYADGASQSPTEIGPNQVLTTEALAFADADTAGFTYVNFSTSAWVGGDFAIGVDLEPLYGTPADTLVLFADEDGSSDGSYTWTKLGFDLAPGQYFWTLSTGLLQGGLDVNPAIFAVVAESANSIEEQNYLNGVKMTTYPNPAVSADNLTIQYGLETAAERVDVNIYTTSGQLVYTKAEGAKTNGVYRLNVPAGTLSAGSYLYTIDADGKRMAKRLEILK